MERGWGKAAQICISHAFMIQDIDTSIGEFDVSNEDYLFMKKFLEEALYDDYDRLVQLCNALHWRCLWGFVFWKRDLWT